MNLQDVDILELMKRRRTIRKYEERQIPRADLEKIIEAGLYAPSAGGGQRAMICGIYSRELCEQLGRLNIAKFDRSNLAGYRVSSEQPSIIDDATMKSGFYGAPAACAVFGARDFLYSVADAFCCAQNMVLAATALGIASCIVARGEETFDNELGAELLRRWEIPDHYVARCFVLLGYCRGDYPAVKARKEGRWKIVES